MFRIPQILFAGAVISQAFGIRNGHGVTEADQTQCDTRAISDMHFQPCPRVGTPDLHTRYQRQSDSRQFGDGPNVGMAVLEQPPIGSLVMIQPE